jgi:hypothetical protein
LTMTTFHNLYRLIFFYKPEDEYPWILIFIH